MCSRLSASSASFISRAQSTSVVAATSIARAALRSMDAVAQAFALTSSWRIANQVPAPATAIANGDVCKRVGGLAQVVEAALLASLLQLLGVLVHSCRGVPSRRKLFWVSFDANHAGVVGTLEPQPVWVGAHNG